MKFQVNELNWAELNRAEQRKLNLGKDKEKRQHADLIVGGDDCDSYCK